MHHSPSFSDFWNTERKSGPLHTPITDNISEKRFEQLRRYLQVSDPSQTSAPKSKIPGDTLEPDEDGDEEGGGEELMWWLKLEPLLSTFHRACRSRWIPGSNVSLDEMMVKSYRRSEHTKKMPYKRLAEGIKYGHCGRGATFFPSCIAPGCMGQVSWSSIQTTPVLHPWCCNLVDNSRRKSGFPTRFSWTLISCSSSCFKNFGIEVLEPVGRLGQIWQRIFHQFACIQREIWQSELWFRVISS